LYLNMAVMYTVVRDFTDVTDRTTSGPSETVRELGSSRLSPNQPEQSPGLSKPASRKDGPTRRKTNVSP